MLRNINLDGVLAAIFSGIVLVLILSIFSGHLANILLVPAPALFALFFGSEYLDNDTDYTER